MTTIRYMPQPGDIIMLHAYALGACPGTYVVHVDGPRRYRCERRDGSGPDFVATEEQMLVMPFSIFFPPADTTPPPPATHKHWSTR